LAVSPIHPGGHSPVIIATIVLGGAVVLRVRPELLDDNGIAGGHRATHVLVPSGCIHLDGSVRIKVRGINNAIPGGCIRQMVGGDSGQVIGPT
jgi:hypothetical protein